MSMFQYFRQKKNIPITSFLFVCIAAFALFGLGGPPRATAAEKSANLSRAQKMELVEKGVAQFKSGELAQSKMNLEKARAEFSENFAAPYYLGLIYLQESRRSDAIAQWQQYVSMNPNSENAHRIQKMLTILKRRQARDQSKRAIAEKKAWAGPSGDRKKVVVTTFEHINIEGMGPLGKGMADILIDDLSRIPGIEGVDRIQLIELLIAMQQGDSGLIIPEDVPRVGQLLAADYVSSGNLTLLPGKKLQIASQLVNTRKEKMVGTQQTQGELKKFYELEKKIACMIAKGLDKNCEDAPPEFGKTHTDNLQALISYSWGLEFFDEQNYDEARSMFRKALNEDPKFELAQQALLATPYTAMAYWNTAQIISSATENGLSPAAAASATEGTAVARSADTADRKGGFKIGKGKIIAGALAVGLVAAAAAGGGGGGGDDGGQTTASQPHNLAGTWKGTWESGDFKLNLSQNGTSLEGTLSLTGSECLSSANVSGGVSGDTINLTIDSGTGSFQAAYNDRTYTMNGLLDFSSNGCTLKTTVLTTLTGGADVSW